jgi:hypothetical protein
MPPPFGAIFDTLHWAQWVGIGVGVLIAPLVFLVGRSLANRRRTAEDAHVVLKEPDPFVQGGSNERRTAPRRRGNPVSVLVSDAEVVVEPVRGWVLDRSGTGLGLELLEEGEVAIGTILSIRPTEASEHVPWVRIEVRNRQKVGTTWRLGCQFVKPPAWDVLMRFG